MWLCTDQSCPPATNVARNSPPDISDFEIRPLELQRLWAISKNDRVKLRATFGRDPPTTHEPLPRPDLTHPGYPKMSHVIPLHIFQTLKSDRWNCNVCGPSRKMTELNYVRLLLGRLPPSLSVPSTNHATATATKISYNELLHQEPQPSREPAERGAPPPRAPTERIPAPLRRSPHRRWGFCSIRNSASACRRRVTPLMMQIPPIGGGEAAT